FVRLGALPGRVQVSGNLKFDMAPVDADAFAREFAAHAAGDGPAWIAASTHEGEEAAVLDAHLELLRAQPGALLLWAPRHPERFRAVAERARAAGLAVALRSTDTWPAAGTQVFVVDTLGEHNLLEPAATGTAILSGPQIGRAHV